MQPLEVHHISFHFQPKCQSYWKQMQIDFCVYRPDEREGTGKQISYIDQKRVWETWIFCLHTYDLKLRSDFQLCSYLRTFLLSFYFLISFCFMEVNSRNVVFLFLLVYRSFIQTLSGSLFFISEFPLCFIFFHLPIFSNITLIHDNINGPVHAGTSH